MPVGHRRRRNGVVGAIHRRGDVREVREGGGRGAARGVGVGWEARRREAAALKHTGDAARRGHGEGAHPVRLGSTSGRRVGAASADQSVDEGLGVGTEAAALLHSPGEKAVVWLAKISVVSQSVGREHEVTVGTDLTGSSSGGSRSVHHVGSDAKRRLARDRARHNVHMDHTRTRKDGSQAHSKYL